MSHANQNIVPITFKNIVNTQSFIQRRASGPSGTLGFFLFALKCLLRPFIALLPNQFLFLGQCRDGAAVSAHTWLQSKDMVSWDHTRVSLGPKIRPRECQVIQGHVGNGELTVWCTPAWLHFQYGSISDIHANEKEIQKTKKCAVTKPFVCSFGQSRA